MATQAQLIDRLDNLSKSMQQYWDPETFFSELLQIFGASKTLVEKSIYDCNKNEKDHSLNHSSVKLYHADLFCDKRAYFRFPAKDEDTGIALKEVKENLTKIRGGVRDKYPYIFSASPHTLLIYDQYHDENISIRLNNLTKYYTQIQALDPGYKRITPIAIGQEADVKACRKLTMLLTSLSELNELQPQQMHSMYDFIRRVLFCLFADDTGIFAKDQFQSAFCKHVNRNGDGAEIFFNDLFLILNTAPQDRIKLQDIVLYPLLRFPYVNGGLFKEKTR